MSEERIDTYSVHCNCGTCLMLRDAVAPSCRGCRKRHDEVVTLKSRLSDAMEVVEAGKLLRIAVAGYQNDHDHLGGDHVDTGRSWMLMTRARDNFRTALAKLEGKGE